jgi:hypothetical protein
VGVLLDGGMCYRPKRGRGGVLRVVSRAERMLRMADRRCQRRGLYTASGTSTVVCGRSVRVEVKAESSTAVDCCAVVQAAASELGKAQGCRLFVRVTQVLFHAPPPALFT